MLDSDGAGLVVSVGSFGPGSVVGLVVGSGSGESVLVGSGLVVSDADGSLVASLVLDSDGSGLVVSLVLELDGAGLVAVPVDATSFVNVIAPASPSNSMLPVLDGFVPVGYSVPSSAPPSFTNHPSTVRHSSIVPSVGASPAAASVCEKSRNVVAFSQLVMLASTSASVEAAVSFSR